MALNIDLVNGAVNVYETGETPRTYFGATGASGKFYQSGSVDNGIGSVVLFQNNSQNLEDGDYDEMPISSTSGNGVNATLDISIDGGAFQSVVLNRRGSGYADGDTLVIDANYFGGTGTLIFKVTSIYQDSFLIVIGGDTYQVKWNNLIINGTTPTSLSNAASLLSTLFSSLSSPYKSYIAIYSLSGVAGGEPPVLINVLENKITPNQTPSISYVDSGIYEIGFLGSVLVNNRTFVMCNMWGNSNVSPLPSSGYRLDDQNIRIANADFADGASYILVEVRVYN